VNGILVADVGIVESEGRDVDASWADTELVCRFSSFLFSLDSGCVSSPFSGLFFLSLVFILFTFKRGADGEVLEGRANIGEEKGNKDKQ
jgi:hypothetical protein